MKKITQLGFSTVVTLLVALVINTSLITSALAVDVTATVSIPQISATRTQVTVAVCNEPGISCLGGTANIAAGSTQGSTTISGVTSGLKHIRTSCFSGCDAPLIRTGYSSGGGASSERFEDREIFTVGTENIVRPVFALATGSTVSGVVSVAIPQTANRSVQITLCPIDDGSCVFSTQTLQANASTLSYAIGVPTLDSYEISFDCFSCSDPLFDRGFYSESASNGTTTLADNATIVSGAQDASSIDFTIIRGVEFTGTIFSPVPVTRNTSISLTATSDSGDFQEFDNTSIAINQSSATYSLLLAPENDWEIRTSCFACDDSSVFGNVFVAQGRPNNTDWNRSRATLISGTSTQTVNDLTFFASSKIFGTITMPDATRSQSLDLDVFAFNQADNGFVVGSAFIGRDLETDNYELNVPAIFTADNPIIVGLTPDLDNQNDFNGDYVPFAFHDGTSNSQTNRTKALALATQSGNLSNIDMAIEVGNVISGTINIPDSQDAESNLLIHMIADQLGNAGADLDGFDAAELGGYGGYGGNFGNGNYLYNGTNSGLLNYFPLRISANSGSSRPYSIRISSDAETSWRTYYGCLNCGSDFQQYGFFKDIEGTGLNPEETLPLPSSAQFVAGGSDYVHDLFLLEPSQSQEFCFPIKIASGGAAVICL